MDPVPLRPIRTPGLPREPVPGRYKLAAADFVVDELPLYPPAGTGGHVWAHIEKRGRSTPQAIDAIATALGLRARDVGYAGLKDAQAVTRQWLSLGEIAEERVRALELPGISVLEVSRHDNKLKVGHLAGNRFDIVVRGAAPESLDAVRENLAWLARFGVANWFGEQRFGSGGRNLAKGLRILFDDPRRASRGMSKRLVRLLVSAVQSEVFNHVLAERIDDYCEAIVGDVAWLHRNGACFLVEDEVDARVRCERFEISPTGPLPGPKMLRAGGDQGELEAMVLEALELDLDVFGNAPGGGNEGARRPLRVRLQEPSVEVVPASGDDPRSAGLRLRFSLERGAYATSVLRELLCDPPWFAAREDGAPDDAQAAPDGSDDDGASV
ncbi:MAG: tRNA pseudouridine(13) synthase TruD [Planctomycetes bacterium]|nr:tRNA pseudouridine(13) synthase TruD [Planctomycetota bacterium]